MSNLYNKAIMQLTGDNSDGHHDEASTGIDFNEDPMLSALMIGSMSTMVWLWGFLVMFPDRVLTTCNFSMSSWTCAGYTSMFFAA